MGMLRGFSRCFTQILLILPTECKLWVKTSYKPCPTQPNPKSPMLSVFINFYFFTLLSKIFFEIIRKISIIRTKSGDEKEKEKCLFKPSNFKV